MLVLIGFNVIKNFMSVTEILEEELCVYGSSLPRENKYVNTEHFLGLVIDEINLHGYIKVVLRLIEHLLQLIQIISFLHKKQVKKQKKL